MENNITENVTNSQALPHWTISGPALSPFSLPFQMGLRVPVQTPPRPAPAPVKVPISLLADGY